MPDPTSRPELKVIILAAGSGQRAGVDYPKVLQPLGDAKIIDYVVKNALRFAAPGDIYIVIGRQGDQVQAHLGTAYNYVLQPAPRGTGDAVRCTAPFLRNFAGDLLILYGDTPLFRPSPLRGLVNRHYLKGATLTLFTAVAATAQPYGRIVRDEAGRIVDIVETAAMAVPAGEIRELNIGAYVVSAAALYPALDELSDDNSRGEFLLTDCVRLLVQSDLPVAAYQSYVQADTLGINTAADLEEAELVLQERLFRPQRLLEENLIKFGTGGWRAIIGESFTIANVQRLCQALANTVVRRGQEAQGAIIGYDRRFLGDRAAAAAAGVFAGNNIPVQLLREDVPTPLVTYVTAAQSAAFGLIFTASHNPPEWNGLKVFHTDGSLLQTDETNAIEAEANGLTNDDIVRLDLEPALAAGIVRRVDYTNEYVDAVEKLIDLAAIRRADLRIAIDPMYGTGQVTLGIILTEARCRLTILNEHRNPLFGGRSPAPNVDAIRSLITTVRDGGYDLGLAMDGDADRIAIVDEAGNYIHINDILLLLYHYLVTVKGERGGVVRNTATTHMLDRLARHLGEKSYEVPVGFKHIAAAMQAHDALLGGESSGGLTIRGHILGKDGIFASALVVEMLARTGRSLADLLAEIYAIVGQQITVEEAVPATPAMKLFIPRYLKQAQFKKILEYPVTSISFDDGIKIRLNEDRWLLFRFSGTEPVLRLFAEAESEAVAQRLVDWARGQLIASGDEGK